MAPSLVALLGRVHTMASAGLRSEVWVHPGTERIFALGDARGRCCVLPRRLLRQASAGGMLGVIVDSDGVLPLVCLGDI